MAESELDTIEDMSKRKPSGDSSKKRYPSRENIRYVAIPADLHALLARYAQDKSDVDEKKSVNWAARRFIRKGLTDEGYTSPKPKS